MGLLDEAIREHLELKRLHGAAEDDLARQEAEALGPVSEEDVSVAPGNDADATQGDAEGAWPFDRVVETGLDDESDPPWFDWSAGGSGDVELPPFVSPEPAIDEPRQSDPVTADPSTASFEIEGHQDAEDAAGPPVGFAEADEPSAVDAPRDDGEEGPAEGLDADAAVASGPETELLPADLEAEVERDAAVESEPLEPEAGSEGPVFEPAHDEPFVEGAPDADATQAYAIPADLEPVEPVPDAADDPGELEDALDPEPLEPEQLESEPEPSLESEPLEPLESALLEPEPLAAEPEPLAAEPEPLATPLEVAPQPADDVDLPPEEEPPPVQADPLTEVPPLPDQAGDPSLGAGSDVIDPYAPPPGEHDRLRSSPEPLGELDPTAEQGQPPGVESDGLEDDSGPVTRAWSLEDDPSLLAASIDDDPSFSAAPIEERPMLEPLPDAEDAPAAELPDASGETHAEQSLPAEEHGEAPSSEPAPGARGFFEETEEHEPLWREDRPGADPDFEN